jgi:hypothetical protein
MNHYQKVGTVLIRAAGIATAALGVFGFLYGVGLMVRGIQLTAEQADRFGGSVWYVVFGVVLYLLGRPLGRLVGRGLG